MIWFLGFSTRFADSDDRRQVNAFIISKDVNRSLVVYDAKLNENCRFDEDEPVEIYWRDPKENGGFETNGLNMVERGIYKIMLDRITPHQVEGEVKVKALWLRKIHLPLRITSAKRGEGCEVKVYVRGKDLPGEIKIEGLRLQNFSGFVPSEMIVIGKDARTGKSTRSKVTFG